MKMSEALADEGSNVLLLARKGIMIDSNYDFKSNSIFSYYSVKRNFNIRFSKIRSELIYLIYVLLYVLYKRPSLVYTRIPSIAMVTCLFKINTVLHCHGPIYNQNGIKGVISLLIKKYIKLLPRSRYFLKFAVVSEGLKFVYEKDYLIDSPKLKVISNGVDLKRFNPLMSKEKARKQINLFSETKVICYSGQLYEGRGVDLIIQLAEIFKDYIFLLVGGHPEQIYKKREQAANNVYFVGHVPNGNVPLYLFSADILLLPYQESLQIFGGNVHSGDIIRPLKMFEYMASNRPIIASDLPGLREVLNTKNSILVSPEKIHQWVEAIKLLCKNPNLASEISAKALEDVKIFTCRRIAEKILE